MSTSPSETHVNDLLPVRSRVSWGAIFAGLFVALTIYVLLGALGAAIGLSISDRVEGDRLASGAGIWAIITLLIALFCGGCVAAQCTAGETKGEAIVYGVILWGVMFAAIVWMSGSILRAGLGGSLRAANVLASADPQTVDWERAARDSGITREQIDKMRASMPTAAQVRDASKEAAWWSFAGLLASLGAAIAGALVGAGPTPFLRTFFIEPVTLPPPGHMHPTSTV